MAFRNPLDDPDNILLGNAEFCLLFNGGTVDIYVPMPLPGIVIFAHGVNSDGEWYDATEQGLCEGLNARLGRRDQDLARHGPETGQLHPVKYGRELTDDGFISPNVNPNMLIDATGSCSPVIRFRWGYKANSDELQQYGSNIYLNEEDYWGGGPFANGCTSLPDLWNQGMTDSLFLWLHVEHLNPSDRKIFACPPRPYFVLAAYRLAKLIESIRMLQADTPITVVCHSQGTMVGMAAAFLGDRMAPATDRAGMSAPCVADNYVLCNSPYSLVQNNSAENWTESHLVDRNGRTGRQTEAARIATLKAFFDIIRKRRTMADTQTIARIDQRMTTEGHVFSAQTDRTAYGLKGSNASGYGRVTLYCNPHDQVISALTVQGIGWRGLSGQRKDKTGLYGPEKDGEIGATGGDGVFVQRVFAQGYEVGRSGSYHFWHNHWRQPKPGSEDFWFPRSLRARYEAGKGLAANDHWVAKVFTVGLAPVFMAAMRLADKPINAMPDRHWQITLEAPDLPAPFKPEARRFGQVCEQFDQGCDPDGAARNQHRNREADDPYADDPIPIGGSDGQRRRQESNAAQGDAVSEAALRYEHHARLRMQARREGRYKNDEKVTKEDEPDTADAEYKAWHNQQIKAALDEASENYATDHSTIMTNDMHAREALAYDVAIGVCDIQPEDLHKLRLAADWRLVKGTDAIGSHRQFGEYFKRGLYKKLSAFEWANAKDSVASMPRTIVDERLNPPRKPKGIDDAPYQN